MPQTQRELSINVPDELTLTPFTGASLVNEILKGILYQKCQIPYPYVWLKQVVEKRRKRLNSEENQLKKINFTHENHYRVVSAAYDHLDLLMKGITKEFCESHNSRVEEIVVVLGPSPNCPKEAFTITIPSIVRGHIERNHVGLLNKHLQKALRNIFLSQAWMDSIDASLSCTNIYIYLKKIIDKESNSVNEPFKFSLPPNITTNIKHSKFFISNSSIEITNCCGDLMVYEENMGDTKTEVREESNSAGHQGQVVWCRSKKLLKGFKDCFVNKVSVSELW